MNEVVRRQFDTAAEIANRMMAGEPYTDTDVHQLAESVAYCASMKFAPGGEVTREKIARTLYDCDFRLNRVTDFPPWDDARGHVHKRYFDRADAVLSLLSPSPEGWREIETAPTDGTAILIAPSLWLGRTCDVAVWDDDRHASKPKPYWRRDGENSKTVSRTHAPRYWQHLPPAAQPPSDQREVK